MSNRKQLSYEQHVDLGKRLKTLNAELMEITLKVAHHTPKQSLLYRQANHALMHVGALRAALDNDLCALLPADDKRWKGVYYGRSPEVSRIPNNL